MNNELFTDTDQKYFSVVRNPSLVPWQILGQVRTIIVWGAHCIVLEVNAVVFCVG